MRTSKPRFRLRRSLIAHVVMLFLCALIPLQAMGIALFISGANTIALQIEGESYSTLRYLYAGINTAMDTLYSNLCQIESNAQLRQLGYMGNSLLRHEYYSTIEDLQQHLLVIVQNNQNISEIEIYLPKSNSVFQVQRYSGLSESRRNHRLCPPEAIDTLVEAAREYGAGKPTFDQDEAYLTLLYPESCYHKGSSPDIVIRFQLALEEFEIYLSSRNVYKMQNTVYFTGNADDAIFGAENTLSPEIVTALWHEVQPEMKIGSPTWSGLKELEGREYFVSAYCPSKTTGACIQLIPSNVAMSALFTYRTGLVVYIVVSLSVLILFVAPNLKLIHKPVRQLVNAFHEIEAGNYAVTVESCQTIEELDHLMSGFNSMAEKLNDTINRLYKQELYTRRMELNQLQMQINPHFLFNSYFMMDRLIRQEDWDTALELSNYLGEYFRYINRDAHRFIELSMEWKHMHSYAMVQQLRYNRRLQMEIQPVPEQFADYILPRLILQPLVENAVEHGLSHTERSGLCTLKFEWDDENLRILIEDSGDRITDVQIDQLNYTIHSRDLPGQETTALINIHRRLKLCYGEGYGLTLARAELGGLKVIVVLPIQRKEDTSADTEHPDR